MWLYGIHVTIEKAESFISPHVSVNFHNVNRILKDSSHQLTEKAEKCKKFFQLYGPFLDTSKTHLKGPDPQILMKIFESEYLAQRSPLSTKTKSVSKCLTEIFPGLAAPMKEKSGSEGVAPFTNNVGCDKEMGMHIADALKHHIDQKFSEYERQMAVRVEEKLMELERKQSKKLDSIMKCLEDIKSALNIRSPEG
jgi:hypothetical protein